MGWGGRGENRGEERRGGEEGKYDHEAFLELFNSIAGEKGGVWGGEGGEKTGVGRVEVGGGV